ncbi:hypothetical protein HETIRDRAFT_445244 [Heterobasidion irregulare TC 32-1]|uniref:Mitochondrial outer membrane protein OM14 C-terminal domain-containing protein n=1 Tax=Heterobasidion irregulare (strain TC 32-1) TaxID=747525 RepID=W4K4N0_HETIT|nr:uncharacterized protein HETIRDRAFT_445244 [Heterobasidion irregulare TC 32-1]ETW80714.1 hypothetical protein HETIRDRAFT_445244 [Heterobasidion irregulare TC 32-1]
MSYASVAAQDAPPLSEQPKPDPALLNTGSSRSDAVADDTSKVKVVPADFKDNLSTFTSETRETIVRDAEPAGDEARSHAHKAEAEGLHYWEVAKDHLLRPAIAGGLIGIVNIGLFAGASYAYYTHPPLRRDARAIASTVAVAVALLGGEGYAAEQFRQTPQGKKEERRAREEGSLVYRHAREHILRPGVLGGIVGLVNVGILGAVGYLAYTNWERPKWDRRAVSAISVGLMTLWSGEGFVAERYREGKIHPPRS